VNSSKGNQTGNSLSHNETTLDAGNAVNITSGRDTTLKGAQVSGESITADVGRNLTLQSEQDSDRYDSKQQSASAGGSFTFGSMTGSVNANVSRDNIHSNFDSVKEQTGLFAGQGGYNITVGNHTQLDGAVISSSADKDKNLLDTGTLGWTDIHNEADYKSEHQSAGFNSGGPIGANLLSNVGALPISGAGSSGHAEGTTKSAISEGGLIIRNKDVQSQSLTGLSRDTEHANDGAVNPIFDKEKEQKRLQQAQAVSDIASQALDIYNTYEATKATRAATASILDPQLKAGYEGKAIAELAKAKALNPDTDVSPTAVINKAWQLAYDSALSQQGANMGGSVRVGVNAVVNALQALAGGDIKAALAQGAAPYLAAKVKEMTTGNADYSTLTEAQKLNNLMAHAILGGVIAELSGGNAASGASGAITGELAAPAIALAFYGTADSDKLTSAEKENVSALATLASGIAAGMVSDSASGAVTGAQAGKNAVENNSLSGDKARKSVKQSAELWKNEVRDKLGNGTTSSIANGIINALAETGDSAIGSVDYVADAAMALASCTTGDGYCDRALNDLSGKNQAVADNVKALMKSDTWSAIADTLASAWDGNQAALEATGGIVASIILPGKKVPNVSTGIISESVAFSTKQLDKKFKHAADFGVTTTRKNGDTIAEYQTAIKSHLDNKTTYEHGTYLLVPESKVFFNPQTNNVVVVDKSGNFVSGWKLDSQTKQYENFINNGTLR